MAARLQHPSATPATLDLTLRELSETPEVPVQDHTTDYGTRLRYVLGVKFRRATVKFQLTRETYSDFKSFYQSVTNANTRFTFIADTTNDSSDVWSAYFVSTPEFQREEFPGPRMLWTVSVDIEDVPSSL